MDIRSRFATNRVLFKSPLQPELKNHETHRNLGWHKIVKTSKSLLDNISWLYNIICIPYLLVLQYYLYNKISKTRLNGSHIIRANGIYCFMYNVGDDKSYGDIYSIVYF